VFVKELGICEELGESLDISSWRIEAIDVNEASVAARGDHDFHLLFPVCELVQLSRQFATP
jgi:hypothetical protein